ncbi:protein of unknown function [Caballeronia sp. S22]
MDESADMSQRETHIGLTRMGDQMTRGEDPQTNVNPDSGLFLVGDRCQAGEVKRPPAAIQPTLESKED